MDKDDGFVLFRRSTDFAEAVTALEVRPAGYFVMGYACSLSR